MLKSAKKRHFVYFGYAKLAQAEAVSYAKMAQVKLMLPVALCQTGITSEFFSLFSMCQNGTDIQDVAMLCVFTVAVQLSTRGKKHTHLVDEDSPCFAFR